MTFISFARLVALSESCILGDIDGRSVLSLLFSLDSPGQFHPSFFRGFGVFCCFHAPIRTLPSFLAIANESVHAHSLSSLSSSPLLPLCWCPIRLKLSRDLTRESPKKKESKTSPVRFHDAHVARGFFSVLLSEPTGSSDRAAGLHSPFGHCPDLNLPICSQPLPGLILSGPNRCMVIRGPFVADFFL